MHTLNSEFLQFQKLTLLFLLIYLPINLLGQSYEEIGRLPTQTYLPDEYNGHYQVWDTEQGDNGLMYFAHSEGIAEYDGVSFRSLFNKDSIAYYAIRHLGKNKKGQIYYTGTDLFGYLSTDKFGVTKPVSIFHFIPKTYRPIGGNLSFQFIGPYIFLQSRSYLFRLELLNDSTLKSLKTWKSETSFTYTFKQDEKLYVHQTGKGLFYADGENLKLLPGTEILGGERVQIMLPYPASNTNRKQLLLGSFNAGLFIYDGQTLTKLAAQLDPLLKKGGMLYKAVQLSNGNYALAIIGFGVIIMSPQGQSLRIINSENGIQSDLVTNIYTDNTEALWLSSEDGIARVEINSPNLLYGKNVGINTNVISIAKLNNILYLGTSSGLLKFNPKEKLFKPVPEIAKGQIFQILKDGNDLIIPSEKLQLFRNEKVIPLQQPQNGGRSILVIIPEKNRDLMYTGNSIGVSVYSRENSATIPWKYAGDLPGFDKHVRSIAADKNADIWISDLSSTVYQFSAPINNGGILDLKQYILTTHNVGFTVEILNAINGEIFIASKTGYHKYSKVANKFIKDTLQYPAFSNLAGVAHEDNYGRVWLVPEDGPVKIARRNQEGKYELSDAPQIGFSAILNGSFFDSDSIGWLKNERKGLIRFDERNVLKTSSDFFTLIRRIETKKDSLALPDYGRNSAAPFVKLKDNSLRFEFAAPFFGEEKQTKYQTFLEGFNKDWIDWTNYKFKEYTNLSSGKYIFRVRAQDANGTISDEAIFSFIILPPWYATWWAYLLYAALALLIIYWITKIQSRRIVAKEKEKARAKELAQAKEIEAAYLQLSESHEHLKVTQSQLIQSEKMASLGELTAGIAHEIQNPLNFVNNFSEVSNELIDEMKIELDKGDIEEAKTIAEDVKQNLKKINHHGKRADAIVKGMLQHSRSNSGINEPTDINALCDEYLRLAYHGLRAKDKNFNAEMKTDFDDSISKIKIIPQDMGRVILNLITNAFYAVDEKKQQIEEGYVPSVSVSTLKKINENIEIKVADNGNGIPQNMVDKIFQPFFTTKPTGQGTGLGLSLAYDIVKAHGGNISVSTSKENGTTFTVELPNN